MRDNLCSFNGKCNSISPCGEFKLFVVVDGWNNILKVSIYLVIRVNLMLSPWQDTASKHPKTSFTMKNIREKASKSKKITKF